jgi:hypothetical protein
VRLDLPAGWTGRTEALDQKQRLAYIQAANFALHHRAPPEKLRDPALVVTLSEDESARHALSHPVHRLRRSDPVTLKPRDLLPLRSPRRPAGRQRAVFSFEKEKRYFSLEADLGPRRTRSKLRRIDSVLRTLRIEPR